MTTNLEERARELAHTHHWNGFTLCSCRTEKWDCDANNRFEFENKQKTAYAEHLFALLDLTRVQAEARLSEAKAIADHMDRYLDRDTRTMEVWLFVEEHIAALAKAAAPARRRRSE